MKPKNILIIGAGIKGLAIAYQILQKTKSVEITVVEKEPKGIHHMSDSSHNTQVGHSGLYYKPGTLKAILNQFGFELLRDYIQKKKLYYNPCGKIVVGYGSKKDDELLEKYYNNAIGNGRSSKKVRILTGDELRKKELLLSGKITAAIEADEPYIFNANSILDSLAKDITKLGGTILYNTKVTGVAPVAKDMKWTVSTNKNDFQADFIINAAGAQVDRVAKMFGGAKSWCIIPFVGEYKDIDNPTKLHIKHLIYQVPSDPEMPFLDPHAIESDGGIHFGPTAFVKFGMREHYSGNILPHLGDFISAHLNPVTWKLYFRNMKMFPREAGRHFSNKIFTAACQVMLDESKLKIDSSKIRFYKRGIRGQHVDSEGIISNEFGLEKHMLGNEFRAITDKNPGSPGFTASLAVGELIADITGAPEKYADMDFDSQEFRDKVKQLLTKGKKKK
jgi:(S)-2-hydroxyglutarate dehydrogenase